MSVEDIINHAYLQQVNIQEIQGDKVSKWLNSTEHVKFILNPESWIKKNKGMVHSLNSRTPEANSKTFNHAANP